MICESDTCFQIVIISHLLGMHSLVFKFFLEILLLLLEKVQTCRWQKFHNASYFQTI